MRKEREEKSEFVVSKILIASTVPDREHITPVLREMHLRPTTVLGVSEFKYAI